jgi:hypothetical protein
VTSFPAFCCLVSFQILPIIFRRNAVLRILLDVFEGIVFYSSNVTSRLVKLQSILIDFLKKMLSHKKWQSMKQIPCSDRLL